MAEDEVEDQEAGIKVKAFCPEDFQKELGDGKRAR